MTGPRAPTGRTPPGATEYRTGGRAILTALDAMAVTGRTGTAWLTGGTAGAAGALYFRNGRVAGAELAGVPTCQARLIASGRLTEAVWRDFAAAHDVTGTSPPPAVPPAIGLGSAEWLTLSLDAILDAAAELLPPPSGGDSGNPSHNLVLRPDEVPGWTVSGRSIPFRELRTELARRQSVLDRLRPVLTPDSVLRRAAAEWSGPLQISARQWRALRAIGDGGTPRSVAGRLGAGIFATTVLMRGLMVLGMVTADPRAGDLPDVSVALASTLFSAALA